MPKSRDAWKRLKDRLKLRLPIIQAPIGSASSPALAAAVANGGGFGAIAMTWRTAEEIEACMLDARAQTYGPLAANFVLRWPNETHVRLALNMGADAIWTFWGDPSRIAAATKANGAAMLHTAGSVGEAVLAARAGVDAIALQGVEAGGHVRGCRPLRILLLETREQLPETPLVAMGGIATPADVAALIDLGADAVALGTRFVCAIESAAHETYRQAICAANDGDTVLTNLFDIGWEDAPHRVIRNSTYRRWVGAGSLPSGGRPGEGETIATSASNKPIMRYQDAIPTKGAVGDLEALALYAGQSAARVHSVEPAQCIVRDLAAQL